MRIGVKICTALWKIPLGQKLCLSACRLLRHAFGEGARILAPVSEKCQHVFLINQQHIGHWAEAMQCMDTKFRVRAKGGIQTCPYLKVSIVCRLDRRKDTDQINKTAAAMLRADAASGAAQRALPLN